MVAFIIGRLRVSTTVPAMAPGRSVADTRTSSGRTPTRTSPRSWACATGRAATKLIGGAPTGRVMKPATNTLRGWR